MAPQRAARRALAALALGVCVVSAAVTWAPPRSADAKPAKPRGPPPGARRVEPEPDEAGQGDQPRRPCPSRGRKKSELSGRLNLNTATRSELELLPGIGPAKARRILTWRVRHGGFRRIRDLRRVRGIGKKTLRRLKPHLTLEAPSTLERAR